MFAAALETADGGIQPTRPTEEYRRYVPWETLVFRRAALVDMGGFADRDGHGDEDAEIVYRAFLEVDHLDERVETLLTPGRKAKSGLTSLEGWREQGYGANVDA